MLPNIIPLLLLVSGGKRMVLTKKSIVVIQLIKLVLELMVKCPPMVLLIEDNIMKELTIF